MTLQAITPIYLGFSDIIWASTAGLTIDAAGEKVAFVLTAPRTGSIDRVTLRTASVTNSQTLRVGLETIDASGDPTGTQYGGSAVGTQAAPAATTTYEVTLGTAASATAGDLLAIVIQFHGTTGNIQLLATTRSLGSAGRGFPYVDQYTTAWAHSASTVLCCGIRYSDGTYAMIGAVPGFTGGLPFNNTSTPDQIGNLFVPTFRCAVRGAILYIDLDNAADVVWYSGTTEMTRVSLTAAYRGATSAAIFEVGFAEQTLSVGSTYRLVVEPTTGSNVSLGRCTVLAAAHLGGLPLGTALYETSRTDTGSWTDTDTQRVSIWPIVSQLDDGVGAGGGMVVHPGMGGGIRG